MNPLNIEPLLPNPLPAMYIGRSLGKSEYISDWLYTFYVNYVLPFEIKIEKHRMYNGYSVMYYFEGRKVNNVCCDATREIVKMNPEEWTEYLKKEFNAIPRNHHSYFFRTEEDALRFVDWVDAHRLAMSIANKPQE